MYTAARTDCSLPNTAPTLVPGQRWRILSLMYWNLSVALLLSPNYSERISNRVRALRATNLAPRDTAEKAVDDDVLSASEKPKLIHDGQDRRVKL